MKKLSKRTIDFIELFFKADINNITLNRHDIDVLYAHYKYSWYEFDKMDHELEDYKSRIEKAVEYINKKWEEHTYYERNENHLGFCEFSEFEKNDLLNILNGRSDE